MKYLILSLLLGMFVVTANSGMIDDLFGGGEDEFAFEKFDDNSILLAINEDAKVACEDGVCTLSSITTSGQTFDISFKIGKGNENSTTTSSGTVIITDVDGDGYDTDGDDEYIGIKATYKVGKCTQKINVPRSVYYAVQTYMYDLLTETGKTRRGLTPAQEAMIMFYTTIQKSAKGCNY